MLENLEKAILEIKEAFPGMKLLENEDMSRHASMKVGGPVRALASPSDVMSLSKICCILKEHELAPLMLGNCTNTVFPDEGLEDVFAVSTENLTKLFLLPDGAIYAEAGVSLAKLALFAQQNGLAGLEFASGIPGSVGGGLIMNAGAYGGEMKDSVESVVCYYLPEQRLYELDREQCAFEYRSSLFKKMGGCVLLSAVFRLEKGDSEAIAEKMRDYNSRRREKQPLDLPSCGSAFKRPEGYFAAALIEQAGLRGFGIGGAQISEKHCGFVVNRGGATQEDIHALLKHVRNTVYEKFQVELEPEMILLPPGMQLLDRGPAVPRHLINLNDPTL
ncbi:MAG: UDP-N-acetylmuramate dehydrogenase [Oscillospiraceae bacterium]|nr:UDP-N-acetylmuramate dehydrogenase [Oscillospiraceae bacterium]